MRKLFLYIILFIIIFMIFYVIAFRLGKSTSAGIDYSDDTDRFSDFNTEELTVTTDILTEEDSSLSVSSEEALNDSGLDYGYIVYIKNGYVTVYDVFSETVYNYTEIAEDSLSDDVKEELSDKYFIKTKEELHKYMESIST